MLTRFEAYGAACSFHNEPCCPLCEPDPHDEHTEMLERRDRALERADVPADRYFEDYANGEWT